MTILGFETWEKKVKVRDGLAMVEAKLRLAKLAELLGSGPGSRVLYESVVKPFGPTAVERPNHAAAVSNCFASRVESHRVDSASTARSPLRKSDQESPPHPAAASFVHAELASAASLHSDGVGASTSSPKNNSPNVPTASARHEEPNTRDKSGSA